MRVIGLGLALCLGSLGAVVAANTAISMRRINLVQLEEKKCNISLTVNFTDKDDDDFVVLSPTTSKTRPFTTLMMTLDASPTTQQTFKLKSSGSPLGGKLSFSDDTPTLTGQIPATIELRGDQKSLHEDDVQVIITKPGVVCLESARVTVISGVKVRYQGRFLFITNNNEEVARGEVCNNEKDPVVWGATPLVCEDLSSAKDFLIFEEGKTKGQRFDPKGKKRPKIEVLVKEVRTFGPDVDLTGRDSLLTRDIEVLSLTANGAVASLLPGNCPDTTDEFEQVLNAGFRFGESFGLAYRGDGGDTMSHVWRFQPGITANQLKKLRINDLAAVPTFFSQQDAGCTDDKVTYFKNSSQSTTPGEFQCEQPLSVKQLFLNIGGFRGFHLGQWGNWTSRHLKLVRGSQFSQSFIARLFEDSVKAQLANSNTSETDDVFAEAFMQLSEYDWYTLMGNVEKGVASTPGGIDPFVFEEFLLDAGCPQAPPDADFKVKDPF